MALLREFLNRTLYIEMYIFINHDSLLANTLVPS